jgi:hypothetical protein
MGIFFISQLALGGCAGWLAGGHGTSCAWAELPIAKPFVRKIADRTMTIAFNQPPMMNRKFSRLFLVRGIQARQVRRAA